LPEGRNQSDHPIEPAHVGDAAEMPHEIKAVTATASIVQVAQTLLGDGAVDICDGAITALAHRDGICRDAVVSAMNARIHDHRAPDAKFFVGFAERFNLVENQRVEAHLVTAPK
jgi:hypothetical protein